MFNVKMFTDFSAASITNKEDRRFLKELVSVKNATTANYVNFSIFDYQKNDPDSVHFLTYPVGWISHYVENHYAGHDPLLKIDYRNISIVDWDDLLKGDRQAVIYDQLQRFALGNKGITVSTHGGGSHYSALSMLFNCEAELWAKFKLENLDLFQFEADRLCTRYFEFYKSRKEPGAMLTPREREILQLVALGRTDQQVARLIGIGKWTVVSHMQSAKYKLDCSNRAAAVAKAVTYGLIDIKRAV